MVAIIAALIPVLLKLVEMWLNKMEDNKEQKKAFLEFVNSISKRNSRVAVKLNKESIRQLEELKKMDEKLH